MYDKLWRISEWFTLTRGLFQGNPLSSTLFILIVEIMSTMIRENEDIKGICILDMEFKIVQFADDTNLFLLFEEKTIQATTNTLTVFERNSGLKLNYEKSNVFRIGALKDTDVKIYTTKQLAWTNDLIKVLGVNISHDKQIQIESNYEHMLDKIQTIFKAWQNRGLSLLGNTMLVNTLVGSLFVYKMNVFRKKC